MSIALKKYIHTNGKITLLLLLILTFYLPSFSANSKPKVDVEHGHSLGGFARVRILNKITKDLACYIAIDGHKIKIVLPALNTSRWITATDKRFNHTHFSTWCSYLTLHPEYEKYRTNY